MILTKNNKAVAFASKYRDDSNYYYARDHHHYYARDHHHYDSCYYYRYFIGSSHRTASCRPSELFPRSRK